MFTYPSLYPLPPFAPSLTSLMVSVDVQYTVYLLTYSASFYIRVVFLLTSGHCSFDYRTMISTASRGYYCVYQSFVKRDFLVWCPKVPITAASQSGSGALSGAFSVSGAVSGAGRVGRSVPQQGVYQPKGHFLILSKKLPTLCSCRGYFCDHHAAAVH